MHVLVENLSFSYFNIDILHNINLQINEGEIKDVKQGIRIKFISYSNFSINSAKSVNHGSQTEVVKYFFLITLAIG